MPKSEAYTTPEGNRVRAIRYRADFSYDIVSRAEDEGEPDLLIPVVEDVKSRATATRVYQVKKKLMIDRYGIRIREV